MATTTHRSFRPLSRAALAAAIGIGVSSAAIACGGGSGSATSGNPLTSGALRDVVVQPTTGRDDHTATPVGPGQVLLAGGVDTVNGGFLATAERFRPLPEDFRPTTQPMTIARARHTATLLRSGDVLIAGGENNNGPLAGGEVFDEGADVFVPTTAMTLARVGHQATALANGLVVMTGGNAGAAPHALIEIFDPGVRQFAPAGNLAAGRTGHQSVLLNDGRVMILGGRLANGNVTSTIEIYDPRPGFQFSRETTNPMSVPRADFTAIRLGNGGILIAGGTDGVNVFDSVEIFNPVTEVTFVLAATLSAARTEATATTIIDGRVLIAGGNGGGEVNADLFDLFDSSIVGAAGGQNFANPRFAGHTAALLSDGSVLIHGGPGASGVTAELVQF